MRLWAVAFVAAGWLAATAAPGQTARPAPGLAPPLRAASVTLVFAAANDLHRLSEQESDLTGRRLAWWRGDAPYTISRAAFPADEPEVLLFRDWPSALRLGAGALDLDLTPRAGLAMSPRGGQAEAGAMLSLGPARGDDTLRRLRSLGIGDGAAFGDQGRWYLFMAASGRAVGLNMLGNGDRAGWTTDPASTLISDAQLGLGWRRGAVQGALGYVRREVKGDHMVSGQRTPDDSLFAFTVSVKPER